MKMINGVLGPIETKNLGSTLMHEHVLNVDWSMRWAFKNLWVDRDEFVDLAVKELCMAKKLGIKTIVDVTPINLGRDINLIKEVAEKSGVQIIAATGLYFNEEPYLINKPIEIIVELLKRDIEVGIENTNIKASIIKCASDRFGITETNQKLLKATARVHKLTGAPITTHTLASKQLGLLQQDIFEEEGVDLRRVIIGHCGDTNDIEYLEAILKRGSFIGLDRFGDDAKNPLANRIEMVVELCKRGWTNKLLLSHDHVCYVDWGLNDWSKMKNIDINNLPLDFCYINNKVLTQLLQKGLSEEQIKQLMEENPREFFELE